MPLTFTFSGSDIKVVADLNTKLDRLAPALVEKMTLLMTRLQQKARANTPIAMVKESIRDPRAEIQGSAVIGFLTWGGTPTTVSYKGGKEFDIAQIFERGSRTHAINPLTTAGTRSHIKGEKRRFGANILHFYSGGKEVFARYAFPKGIPAQHFMENAVNSMKTEFAEGLLQTIRGVMRS